MDSMNMGTFVYEEPVLRAMKIFQCEVEFEVGQE